MTTRDGISERAAKAALQSVFRVVGRRPAQASRFESWLVLFSRRYPKSRLLHILRIHWTLSAPAPDELRQARISTGALVLVRLVPGQDQIFYLGMYEPSTTAVLKQVTRPGDTVVDVGANIGYFSILCASLGAVVHAFEPELELAEQLRRSAELNSLADRITVNNLALSDRPGRVDLHRGTTGAHSGNSSLLQLPHLMDTLAVSVDAETLDRYVTRCNLRRVRALKIDVEGAELLVLAGATEFLRSEMRPDVIICEVWSSGDGSARKVVIDKMAETSYRPYVLAQGQLVALRQYADRVLSSGDENIVFVRRGVDL